MGKYNLIRNELSGKRLDGILISDIVNIRYLTGFTGSTAMLFVGLKRVIFFTDFRYKYECEDFLEYEELVIVKTEFLRDVKKILISAGVRKLGFEYGAQYRVFEKLRKSFRLRALKGLVENIRMHKDEAEIVNIKLAARRAEDAFDRTRKWIRAGITERKIALTLETNLKKAGCKRIPFDIIVASGKNSALPHACVTDKKIQRGDFVIIDWGGEANGYVSDITRTFLINNGNISEKKKIYNTVLAANRRAIDSIRNDIPCREIDRAAREYIIDKGYGNYFGHATGHGVGLDVHERPSVSSASKDKMSDGLVFTIEPGIYISGIGGVRIEDMIMLERGRKKCLTTLPKSLEIL